MVYKLGMWLVMARVKCNFMFVLLAYMFSALPSVYCMLSNMHVKPPDNVLHCVVFTYAYKVVNVMATRKFFQLSKLCFPAWY